MKKLIGTASVCLAIAVTGCNTGGRSGAGKKPIYGPGSTGNLAAGQGQTGGGGGGGGGGGSVGTFSAGGAMTAARAQHTATALGDGRVLVTGGTDGQQAIYQSNEVFDPVTNTWKDTTQLTANQNDGVMLDPTGTFATARQLHTATLLQNGQVLIAGGLGTEQMQNGQPVVEPLKTAFIFDPTQNRFSPTTSQLAEGRAWHAAALTNSNTVVVAAGVNTQLQSMTTAEVFDPATGSWTQVNPGAGAKHTWGSMVTTQGTTVLVAGCDAVYNAQGQPPGFQIQGFPNPRVEQFDPVAKAFVSATQNVGDRIFMGANAISSGQALFVGGQGVAGQSLAVVDTTELFDGATKAFTAGPTLNIGRFGAEVAEIATSSDQLIVGGTDAQGALIDTCEVYDAYNKAIIGTVKMSTARSDHRAVTMLDGRVLVCGGFDSNNAALDSVEIHTR